MRAKLSSLLPPATSCAGRFILTPRPSSPPFPNLRGAPAASPPLPAPPPAPWRGGPPPPPPPFPATPPRVGVSPPGCRFYPRCPTARPECENVPPPLAELEPGRWVRCAYALS